MKSIKSAKQVFESSNVIITKVMRGINGVVRIDAKTRNWQADKDNFYSEWITLEYANKLCNENYGKNVYELNVTQH